MSPQNSYVETLMPNVMGFRDASLQNPLMEIVEEEEKTNSAHWKHQVRPCEDAVRIQPSISQQDSPPQNLTMLAY